MGSDWGTRAGRMMLDGFKMHQKNQRKKKKKQQPGAPFFSKENLLGKSYVMWEELRNCESEEEEEVV